MAVKQVDVAPFLSRRSRVYQPSSIRGLFPLEQIPDMISFLAGKPNPATFPFESITLNLKPPLDGSSAASATAGTANGHANGHSNGSAPSGGSVTISGKELDEALQYGATAGLPALVRWLEQFQTYVHKRDKEAENWRISVGIGSQDCLSKAFQVLVDDGDPVLMESPAYSYAEGWARITVPDSEQTERLADDSGTLGAITPTAPVLVEIDTDSEGLSPDHLRHVLTNWESLHPGKRRPKILYTIPMGSNPTGYSIPEYRKVEVLQIAKEHNLLILEDDAYAFLYYGPEDKKARSYFELEAEVNNEVGRVVRFDSFSKILSSGMRLGFITAQKTICDTMDLITANSNLQTPSTTQMMAYALLRQWGNDGLLNHCKNVSQFYRAKRDMFESAAKKHLSGVAEWTTPVAGMFLYIKMNLNKDGSDGDSFAIIREKAVKKGVLAVPGTSFMPSGSRSAYVRVSFSLATEEQAEEGFKRLRAVIDDEREGR